jgi:hypothetical protein
MEVPAMSLVSSSFERYWAEAGVEKAPNSKTEHSKRKLILMFVSS